MLACTTKGSTKAPYTGDTAAHETTEPTHRLWQVTQADGEELLVSFTATQGQIHDRYPGAVVRPSAFQTRSCQLAPADQAAVTAWLDSIGETDPEARAQYLAICASDPRALAWTLEQLPRHPAPAPKPKPTPWSPRQWQPAARYGVSPKGHPTIAYEPIPATGEPQR